MITSRTYHSLDLDIITCDSGRIIYLLLPEKLGEEDLQKTAEMAENHSVNIIAISGMDWSGDMTPWKAPGLKEGSFEGNAGNFLERLKDDLFFNLENSLKIKRTERYLIGVSLSGLFAIWAAARRKLFDGVGSISGSLWYDGFVEWLKEQSDFKCERFYVSLGNSEKDSKNKRLAAVEEATVQTVELLIDKGLDVSFEMTEGGHMAPLIPRLEKAVTSLLENR